MSGTVLKEKYELLHEIQKWRFRVLELVLFLDTHPDDNRALEDYNEAAKRLHSLQRTYEERYGPLTNFGGAPSGHTWTWIEELWPWETGM
ncbi:hypothetical protein Adeg_0233 [Ammonifex degensii KC4]|uniref:Protein CotJB domain-containing protein n=1 Tax=Ammonifex degensii (strain DSM 10501 / KC4) TaxID=429009 RepID=C9RAX6_AMMDK|nr:spore coat protein CotJB [Ammonifex degensii]ACX51403.1 hypothetical protein Adeg_0233 [Ammonifex degensii KC4]